MSIKTFLAAREYPAPLSPPARLALLALADLYCADDDGAMVLPEDYAARVGAWASQPLPVISVGLAELETAGILYRDERMAVHDATGHPNAWLTFFPDWEKSWQDAAYAAFAVVRLPIPRRMRDTVLERDRGACRRCGSTSRPTIDHVVPVARGGITGVTNLQVLCFPCNARKGTRP